MYTTTQSPVTVQQEQRLKRLIVVKLIQNSASEFCLSTTLLLNTKKEK